MATMEAKLTIREGRGFGRQPTRYFVVPDTDDASRFNWLAAFETRAEAEEYIRNPPPPPKRMEGITVLDGLDL